MKIIAIIVTVVGTIITGSSSLGMVYSFYIAFEAMRSTEAAQMGIFGAWIRNAQILSYVNLFGVAIIFLGVVLTIVAMFMGRKQQVVS
jgi:hypothetical protein